MQHGHTHMHTNAIRETGGQVCTCTNDHTHTHTHRQPLHSHNDAQHLVQVLISPSLDQEVNIKLNSEFISNTRHCAAPTLQRHCNVDEHAQIGSRYRLLLSLNNLFTARAVPNWQLVHTLGTGKQAALK